MPDDGLTQDVGAWIRAGARYHEISVVAPKSIAGDTLHNVLGAAIFGIRVVSYPPELDNLDHLYRLGQTLGRIHRVGGATSFLHRRALSPADGNRVTIVRRN